MKTVPECVANCMKTMGAIRAGSNGPRKGLAVKRLDF